MNTLIKQLHAQWCEARDKAVRRYEAEGNALMAHLSARCTLFKGTETLAELADLVFTPQGIEFMTRYRFPSLAMFRKLAARYHLDRYGIYVDAGKIVLGDGTPRALLVGKTTAYLKCADPRLTQVYMMHGANADITARGYAVVRVECDGSAKPNVEVSDHAKVLL